MPGRQKLKAELKFVVFLRPHQTSGEGGHKGVQHQRWQLMQTGETVFTVAFPPLNCTRLASAHTYRYHPGPTICAERLSAICADKGVGPPVFKHLELRVLERPPLHPLCYNRRGNGRASRLAAERIVCVSVCAESNEHECVRVRRLMQG